MAVAQGYNENIYNNNNHNNHQPQYEANNYEQQQQLLAQLQQQQQQYGQLAQLHPLLAAISGNNYAKNHKPEPMERGGSYYNSEPSGFDIEQSEDYEYHPTSYDEHPAEHAPAGYYHSSPGTDYGAPPPPVHAKAPPSYGYSHPHAHPHPHPHPHPYPKPYAHPHPPPEPIITISKEKKKSKKSIGSTMNALTLLAFFFFVNILQNCIKDHMNAMNPTVMVLTANRIRPRNNKLAEMNSREQTSTVAVTQPEDTVEAAAAAAAAATANILVQSTAGSLPAAGSLNIDGTVANHYNNKLQNNKNTNALIMGTVGATAAPPAGPANANYVLNQPAANANNFHALVQANSHLQQQQQQQQLLLSQSNNNNNNYNNNNYQTYEQAVGHTHTQPSGYANNSGLITATFNVRHPLTNYPTDAANIDYNGNYNYNSNNNYGMQQPHMEYPYKRLPHRHSLYPHSWTDSGGAAAADGLSSYERDSFAHDAPAGAAYQPSSYAHAAHSPAPTWSSASLATHSGGSPFYADADRYDDSYYTRIN